MDVAGLNQKRDNMFINTNEYQSKILDIISSNELDKIIDNSVYDKYEFRMSIIFGMSIASMYTSQCKQYTCDVKDDTITPEKWKEFKDYMFDLHEMQDEGCRGCERPSTECRKCMQDYYWNNISDYLKED